MRRRLISAAALGGAVCLLLLSGAQAQMDAAPSVVRKKLVGREGISANEAQSGGDSPVVRRKIEKPASESPEALQQAERNGTKTGDVKRARPGKKTVAGYQAGKPAGDVYVVRKGDSLLGILRERLRIPAGQESRWIAALRELNPGLRDVNRLIPGQKLRLPDFKRAIPAESNGKAVPAKSKAPAYHAGERAWEIISAVVRQAGGTVVRSGRYWVEGGEKEKIDLDSAAVPVVELPGGNRILIDLQGRIPPHHVAAIRWHSSNVTVVREGGNDGVFSLLENIFAASGRYVFRRKEGFLQMGTTPSLRLMVDWVLEQKKSDGETRLLCGICSVSPPSQPIPAPVLQFAGRSGLTLLLVDESDSGTNGFDDIQEPTDLSAIDTTGHRLLLRTLLEALGYAYEADLKIPLYDERRDGYTLVMKTNFLVRTESRTLVIHIGELPVQFQSKLREKGLTLVQVATSDTPRAVIENTLKGLGVPYSEETDQFRPYDDGTPPRWIVEVSALKVQAKGGVVYLVPPDADAGLCGFIEKHWSRRCVRTGA